VAATELWLVSESCVLPRILLEEYNFCRRCSFDLIVTLFVVSTVARIEFFLNVL
jgi:hypothetical protein